MPINRYSDLSVSAYNPMSMEELAMVPMMKRKQHDDILAKQELFRSGLAKVDPYDKHFDEAVKLKQGMESQLDESALELSKSGVNNDMVGKTISLNRQYQDLISPTGKLGQINAEKQNILKINDEYDKYGQQKGWSEAETNYWKSKALQDYNTSPVYDEKGRILKYSGPKEIANKIDYNKRLHELATSAGMTTEEFKQGLPIAVGQDESGYFTQGHQMSGWSKAKNRPQVTQAYNELIKELNDPTSEVRKSADYERRNLNSLQDILGTQKEIYMKNSKSDESNYTIDHFGSGPGAEGKNSDGTLPSSIYDPSSTQEIGKEVKDIDFSKIGSNKGTSFSGSMAQSHEGKKFTNSTFVEKTGKQTYKDVITNPLQQKLYEVSYNRLVKHGRISKNADINDPKVAAKIGFYMKNHLKIPTVGNDIIRADINNNDSLFMGDLKGQTPEDRNQTLTQDVRGNETNSGFRQMIDSETGQKIQLGDGEKIDYVGFDSPVNYRNYKFGNRFENSVMAHKAQILDKSGNFVRNVTISRTPQEMKKALFRRSYETNQAYKKAIENLGEWVQPNGSYSNSKNLKTIQVKYNDDGTFQLKKGNKISDKMSAKEYYNNMDAIMEDVGDKN
jgi:hypothetical protein